MTLEATLRTIAEKLRGRNFNPRREFLLKFNGSYLKVCNTAVDHITALPVCPSDPAYAPLSGLALLVEGAPLWSRPFTLRELP